jgi:hypothetical protein
MESFARKSVTQAGLVKRKEIQKKPNVVQIKKGFQGNEQN